VHTKASPVDKDLNPLWTRRTTKTFSQVSMRVVSDKIH
jgi:hypothetical protein